jgi:hypothetical protein
MTVSAGKLTTGGNATVRAHLKNAQAPRAHRAHAVAGAMRAAVNPMIFARANR